MKGTTGGGWLGEGVRGAGVFAWVLACVASPATALAVGDGEGLADARAQRPVAKARKKAPPQPPPDTGAKPEGGEAGQVPGVEGAAGEGEAPVEAGPFTFGVFGWLRAGYDQVQTDDRYAFVGRNDGFVVQSARLGLEAQSAEHHVTGRFSLSGTSERFDGVNTPQGTREVSMRDAFLRLDVTPWVGVQVGQFKVPFDGENLRGTQDLLFASRAVGQEGVSPGRGLQEQGLFYDRDVGAMVSSGKPIGLGPVGLSYAVMVANGNGANRLLDDNGKPAVFGRVELDVASLVKVGGAALYNPRTIGAVPNLYEERDLGFAGDALLRVSGLEVMAQAAMVKTRFDTVKTEDRTRLAFHGQVGYKIALAVPVMPAYRYAEYRPWQGAKAAAGGVDLEASALRYHTAGVRVFHPSLPLTGYVNYTLTGERAPRQVNNDRLEVLVQYVF